MPNNPSPASTRQANSWTSQPTQLIDPIATSIQDQFCHMVGTHHETKWLFFELGAATMSPGDFNRHLVGFNQQFYDRLAHSGLDYQCTFAWHLRPDGQRCRYSLLVNEDGTAPADRIIGVIREKLWRIWLQRANVPGGVDEFLRDAQGRPLNVNGTVLSQDDPDLRATFARCLGWAQMLRTPPPDRISVQPYGYGYTMIPGCSPFARVPLPAVLTDPPIPSTDDEASEPVSGIRPC
jgi:hypothetical protein